MSASGSDNIELKATAHHLEYQDVPQVSKCANCDGHTSPMPDPPKFRKM